jgi:hypothetical protein
MRGPSLRPVHRARDFLAVVESLFVLFKDVPFGVTKEVARGPGQVAGTVVRSRLHDFARGHGRQFLIYIERVYSIKRSRGLVLLLDADERRVFGPDYPRIGRG